MASFLQSNSYAETLTAVGTMNVITESMNSMAGYGVFATDVAKERISYYNDQIYLYGTDLNAVMTGSEAWARNEITKVIKKRLTSLKEQWYLTAEKLSTYTKNYTDRITLEGLLQLGTIYKDYLRFEQQTIDTAIPLMQEELYNKFKKKLTDLLKANRITQEKHDTWLVKIYTQVYQYKSDPSFMESAFEEEAARYTTVLASPAPAATQSVSTWSSQNTSSQSTLPLKLQVWSTQDTYTETKTIQWTFKKKTPVSLLTQFPNGTKVTLSLLDKNMKETTKIQWVVRGGVIKVSVNKSGTYLIKKK